VLDFAQVAVSRGRIKLAELNGEPIPKGWALDPEGRPTTDPVERIAGAIMTSGGHKGTARAGSEVLTGVLAGGELGPELSTRAYGCGSAAARAKKTGTVGASTSRRPCALRRPGGVTTRRRACATVIKARSRQPGSEEARSFRESPGTSDAEQARIPMHRVRGEARSTKRLVELAASESVPFPGAGGDRAGSGGRADVTPAGDVI